MVLRTCVSSGAAGSLFGKADGLYLYLHAKKLYVECGSTNTGWHISVHYFCTHIKCEVKHCGI